MYPVWLRVASNSRGKVRSPRLGLPGLGWRLFANANQSNGLHVPLFAAPWCVKKSLESLPPFRPSVQRRCRIHFHGASLDRGQTQPCHNSVWGASRRKHEDLIRAAFQKFDRTRIKPVVKITGEFWADQNFPGDPEPTIYREKSATIVVIRNALGSDT